LIVLTLAHILGLKLSVDGGILSAISTIRQGEDLEFVFDLDGEDITGWVCLIQVSQTPEDEFALISRIVLPKGRVWEGFLTQTETMDLEVGLYSLTGFLTNLSTDQERQIPTRFQVGKAWV